MKLEDHPTPGLLPLLIPFAMTHFLLWLTSPFLFSDREGFLVMAAVIDENLFVRRDGFRACAS